MEVNASMLARITSKRQSELCSWTPLASNLQKKPSEPHPLTCSSTVPPQTPSAFNHAAVSWIHHMLAMRPGPPDVLTVGKPNRLKRLREGKKPTQPEQKKLISPHLPDSTCAVQLCPPQTTHTSCGWSQKTPLQSSQKRPAGASLETLGSIGSNPYSHLSRSYLVVCKCSIQSISVTLWCCYQALHLNETG